MSMAAATWSVCSASDAAVDAIMRPGRLSVPCAILAIWMAQPVPMALAQAIGGPGAVDLSSAASNRVLDDIALRIERSTGDPARDADILAQAQARVGLAPGARLSDGSITALEARLRALIGVRDTRTRISGVPGQSARARVDIALILAEERPETAEAEFPYLLRGDRGQLRFILGGGHGVFSDGNPWFGNAPAFTTGNPLVENPAVGADTGSRSTWVESWIEIGLGGVTQIGNTNSAIYGAVSGIGVASRGEDIFRGDARQTFHLEKAYLGYLWGTEDGSRRVNLSFGRQNFSLNDGFLISQFGSQSNAGPRPGIYLAPRTTHDFAALATVKIDKWTGTGFFLNPNEYEPLETDTHLAGMNLRYNVTDRFYMDATYVEAVKSRTRYAAPSGAIGTRDGLQTYAVHARWSDPDRMPGLWLEGELAHQRHRDFRMRAWAGYGTVGYIARDRRWTPSLSYRFSAFSGDDPASATYERFDALFSGGLSEWLQGISLGKLIRPENRLSHRLRFNVAPNPRLNLTLDYFLHRADERNNIGANPAIATLASRDLGQEVQFAARWSISDQLFFLGIASVAFPGRAIEVAAGGSADPWTTLQAQLFWSF